MTVYVAPPGEPLDGDNWQEIGEAILELNVDISGFKQEEAIGESNRAGHIENTLKTFSVPTKYVVGFTSSPEFITAVFGYDVYALHSTVAEWLSRPAHPIPALERIRQIELQDGINRVLINFDVARRYSPVPPIHNRKKPR